MRQTRRYFLFYSGGLFPVPVILSLTRESIGGFAAGNIREREWRESGQTDICIIGGGIAGLSCAVFFAAVIAECGGYGFGTRRYKSGDERR